MPRPDEPRASYGPPDLDTVPDIVAASPNRPADEPSDAGHLLGRRCAVSTFLADRRMPQAVPLLHREHVEAYITDLDRWKPATAHNRYRSLNSFFGGLAQFDTPFH